MMKTNFLRKAIPVLLMATMLVGTVYANNLMQGGVTITIHKESNSVPEAPRSTSPFIAEYQSACNAVILGCTDPVGNVTVTLTSTAGDWYQTVFDTSDITILIPASGNSGHYTLTIATPANEIYVGEFNL